MADTTTTDYEKGIILKTEFDLYKVWRTIPSLLRYPPTDRKGFTHDPSDFAQSFGIEDEVLLDLVKLKTKKAFAERFNVSVETISDWEKKLKFSPSMVDAREWATSLTKNMMLAIYQHAIKKGHPANFKLWLQVVEDFKEVTRQEIDTPNLAEFNVTIKRKDVPAPEPQPVATAETPNETSTTTQN